MNDSSNQPSAAATLLNLG